MNTPSFRGYTDYTAWESDWRSFVVNERTIVQRVSEPTPLLVLRPDHGLIQLFRAHHRMPNPADGGDLITESRLATHGPTRTAKAIIKYVWSAPLPYTMTLVFNVPDALDWLLPMLRQNGCWSTCGPRPDLGLVWIPAPADLLEHLIITGALFTMPARKAGLN